MTDRMLKSLDITNFRSIRGHIHAPLDARVVLVHGENGAGKTSLLSAIELALTGGVQSLHRADPDYATQLLHRPATEGSVLLKALAGASEETFSALLKSDGAQSLNALSETLAASFRERSFLPQSLLGQLLQIYQESGNEADSPLARFVGKLLGLDRLDALEAGLKPLADVRNVRKAVDGWYATENDKARLEQLLDDQKKARNAVDLQIRRALTDLVQVIAQLGVAIDVQEDRLDEAARVLAPEDDSAAFTLLSDQQRRLGAIRREIDAAARNAIITQPADADDAGERFAAWDKLHGARVEALRQRLDALMPSVSLPSAPERLADETLGQLQAEHKQIQSHVAQAQSDIDRHALAQNEQTVARARRDLINEEIASLSSSSGSLSSALAELASFITDDTCPVCDRNYGEVSSASLSDHVHGTIKHLSASAERLLALGRSQGEAQLLLEKLDREIEVLSARKLDTEAMAALERGAALYATATAELESMVAILREGGLLRAADIAARRAVSEAESRDLALSAAQETLSAFAISIGAGALEDGEAFSSAANRLQARLEAEAERLEARLGARRQGAEIIAAIRTDLSRRATIDAKILADHAIWQRSDNALERAKVLRDQGNAIRTAVDTVRSGIIRREFNERLNLVWRDLFVRLAPGEPFVPAFRIPAAGTLRLQPKLVTEHRDGGAAGGTPGAMLSSGNLNTAALTLFLALHLSVSSALPWLILDDPVQSMDDVHIAHFAALLRTLSKEHGRQIVIAVHERQLFEYLRLELSPAFPDDSLLTLELSRGPRRDSSCIPRRYSFQTETALAAA